MPSENNTLVTHHHEEVELVCSDACSNFVIQQRSA